MRKNPAAFALTRNDDADDVLAKTLCPHGDALHFAFAGCPSCGGELETVPVIPDEHEQRCLNCGKPVVAPLRSDAAIKTLKSQ